MRRSYCFVCRIFLLIGFLVISKAVEQVESCSRSVIEMLPRCMSAFADVDLESAAGRCTYNFSFKNFHPGSEELRQEPDSIIVNPCEVCEHFHALSDRIFTKELIRKGYFGSRNAPHDSILKVRIGSREFFGGKGAEIIAYFPENTEEMIRNICGVKNFTWGEKPFGKCAAVGNSGKLLRQSYGSLIDSFDVVLRFNRAPTIGYEPYVGKKTTFRMLNTGRGKHFWHEGKEVLLMRDFEYDDTNVLQGLENQVYFLLPTHKPQVGADGTGMLGIQFLYPFCEEVHIFGYGTEAFNDYSHYFPSIINSVSHPKSSRAFLKMASCLKLIHIHD